MLTYGAEAQLNAGHACNAHLADNMIMIIGVHICPASICLGGCRQTVCTSENVLVYVCAWPALHAAVLAIDGFTCLACARAASYLPISVCTASLMVKSSVAYLLHELAG